MVHICILNSATINNFFKTLGRSHRDAPIRKRFNSGLMPYFFVMEEVVIDS